MNRPSSAMAGMVDTATTPVDTAEVQPHCHYLQRRRSSWARWIIGGVALTGLSLSLMVSGKAEAVSFTFEKIADTNTPIPGGVGNFEEFFNYSGEGPSIDNGNVAFGGGSRNFEQSGVYTNIGGKLNVVADTNTPIPGSTETFGFGKPSLNDGDVAFLGSTLSGFETGVYTNIGGKLNVVADQDTLIPDSTETFGDFLDLSLDNENVAFTGDNGSYGPDGIYTNIGGKLNVVADTNTPIPGGTGNFEYFFSSPSLDNGNVIFQGTDENLQQEGIYTNIGDKLNVIADTNTPIPGGTGNFRYFYSPSSDNGNVVFIGQSEDGEQNGIYISNEDGVLDVVVDQDTPIPGSVDSLDGYFSGLSLDDGNVAFIEGKETDDRNSVLIQQGIYTNIGGTLAEVIAKGELLDGKKIDSLDFGPEGLSGNQIAFKASFSGQSEGIYVATAVPEPASVLGTLTFGAFGASWMMRRRLRKQKLTSCAKCAE